MTTVHAIMFGCPKFGSAYLQQDYFLIFKLQTDLGQTEICMDLYIGPWKFEYKKIVSQGRYVITRQNDVQLLGFTLKN